MSFFHRVAGAKRDTDMTTGNILRHLVVFALPLLVGNIFQQLYNMVDTWVVGNYVSNEAFSAVGTVGPIINLLIGFFSGLASGAGVVISQYYGAKQHDKVHDVVHTAFAVTLIMSAVITTVGLLMIPLMLRLINTPDDVYVQSKTYLTIYFSGVTGLLIYNMSAGILRAVGDSLKPFLYLVVSTVTNIALDLLFVLAFGMGVEGVALATIIAQGLSAILVTIDLLRTKTCVKLNFRHLHIDREMLKKIVNIGLPSGLQMSITSFSNVFVQSYINHFGSNVMASWTAYNKIDALIFLPVASLSMGLTTFVGQNLGNNDPVRAKKGLRTSLIMSCSMTALLILLIVLFAPDLVYFFNSKPEVVELGGIFLKKLSPFYIFLAVNNMYIAALRGAGNSRAPMLAVLGSYVLFRQIYLFVVSRFISYTELPIGFSYPAGWIMCCIVILVYYHFHPLSKAKRVVD